jgi:hypothetical protein
MLGINWDNDISFYSNFDDDVDKEVYIQHWGADLRRE